MHLPILHVTYRCCRRALRRWNTRGLLTGSFIGRPAIEIRARQDPWVPLVGRVWRLTPGSTVAELRPFEAGGFPLLRCGECRVHSVQLRQRRFFLRTTFPAEAH